jgi:hypothetical protein
MSETSPSEAAFRDQLARFKLLEVAKLQVAKDPNPTGDLPEMWVSFFLGKGWVTKKTPHMMTSKGWDVATAMLKR